MKKFVLIVLLLLIINIIVLPVIFNTEKQVLTEEIRSQTSGSYIQLPDGVTHYEIDGPDTAEVVVLVHGGTVPYYIWDPTFEALKDSGMRVLRYDIFGRGFSDRPNVTYNKDFFIKQLHDLMESLEIQEPVNLVGISMGGAIVAGFTVAYPQLVHKVILIDPFHEGSKDTLFNTPLLGDYLWVIFSNSLPEGQLEDFYQPEKFPDWPERYKEQMKYKGFRRAILSTLRNYITEDQLEVYKQLNELGKPILLIWGEEDKTVPFSTNERIRNVLNVEFLPVEKAGHIPHYERPDVVNPHIISFLIEEKQEEENK